MVSYSLLKTGIQYYRRHPLQTALMILGIALGVAVVLAIDTANASIGRSFELSTQSVTGRTTHQIIGRQGGVDQRIYTKLRTEAGFRQAFPMIDGFIQIREFGERPVKLMGIDPLAESRFQFFLTGSDRQRLRDDLVQLITEPDRVLVSAALASAYQLTAGDTLTVVLGEQETRLQIGGLLEGADSTARSALSGVVIVDIALAQEILDLKDTISRIDLIIEEPEEAAVIELLEHHLPPEVAVVPGQQRSQAIRQMSRSFELNLTALSLLALLVGMFLIYNTVTFSVVQRRRLLGVFRAIGVTRGEVFRLILSEAALMGLIGSLLGLPIGILLGNGTVRLVSRTVTDIYFVLTVSALDIPWDSLVKGLIMGLVVALSSAVFPALEAVSIAPVKALQRSSLERGAQRQVPFLTSGGAGLMVIGSMTLWLSTHQLTVSFAGLLCIAFGGALWVPFVSQWCLRLLLLLVKPLRILTLMMALRHLSRSLSRTSVAIASLMIAVSVIIGVGQMIGSFRHTVVDWLHHTLAADVYLASVQWGEPALDPELHIMLSDIDGIDAITRVRNFLIKSGDYFHSHLVIIEDDLDRRHWVWRSADELGVKRRFQEGWVYVSETFAWRHRIPLESGTPVVLETDEGPKAFPLAGVFREYSAVTGMVVMHENTYRQHWKENRISGMAMTLLPNVEPSAVIAEINRRLSSKTAIVVSSNRDIRQSAIEVFDRTFTVTFALQFLAALIAFIGVFNTITALTLERRREIGILRANGLTVAQLWQMVIFEAVMIGLLAGLLAVPLGTALAWILVFVINQRSFGWTLDFVLTFTPYLQALAVSVSASLLAGLYPAYQTGRTVIAAVLRME
jgi:putative ABC transport system permease protein